MSIMVLQQQQQEHNNRSKALSPAPNIWLPPGFRFHPTDAELITFYLVKKVVNNKFAAHAIAEVDLNKFEPWDLPERASMGEKEWYFFSLRDRKYPTGMRTNRATEAGYWKATGKDRDIRGGSSSNNNTTSGSSLVGMKKTLVFYRGRAPRGEKTNWVMHEYRLEGKTAYLYGSRAAKEEWVVCRIFQKKALAAAKMRGLEAEDTTTNMTSNTDDQDVPCSPTITATFPAAKSELDDHLSGISAGDEHDHQQQQQQHRCSTAAKTGLYSTAEFAKLLDPDFLPPLNNSSSSSSSHNNRINSSPSSCLAAAAAANLMLTNHTSSCFKGLLTKSCKAEPFAGGPGSPLPPPLTDTAATPAGSAATYNAFAGFLGDSNISLAAYESSLPSQQQQLVFQQQHSSSDQGLINELLFSRFLADPSSTSSSDLDQLYAF